MDIEYLLALQDLRASLPEWVSEFMSLLTKFAVGYWPLAISIFIFLVCDRKAGRKILGGFALGALMNGILKTTFCVLRPWLRDTRVEPWGDAKVAATGYSFPSGHSTFATAYYFGWAAYMRKRRVWASALCCVLALLTMFSRNYLGVHTPQDVLIGFASTLLVMYIISRLEDWSDKNPKADLYILLGGILLCIVTTCYFLFKPYPMLYKEDGSLLVDPDYLKADCMQGFGLVLGYIVSRYIERHTFRFDTELSRKERFVFGILAVAVGYFVFQLTTPIKAVFGLYTAKFWEYSLTLVYGMLFVPFLMHIYARFKKSARHNA